MVDTPGLRLNLIWRAHQIVLTAQGRLLLVEVAGDGAGTFSAEPACHDAFAACSARGLLALAARRGEQSGWPPELFFWREFADTFLTAFAHCPEMVEERPAPETVPPAGLFFALTLRIPAMPGAEYASPEVFAGLWRELDAEAREQAQAAGGVKAWLAQINPALHLLGKVTFHLAENKRSPRTPFAFLATYTHRLSVQEQPVHLPLARALHEYAGAKNQAALRSLLEPVQRAAERSLWLREQFESRRLFQPQAWTPAQAYAFLREVPALEAAGIITRIPKWWKNGRGNRPRVTVRVGKQRQAGLGLDSLLSFRIETTLDGEPLTEEEWRAPMSADSGLVSLRGQWVEVDREKLNRVLEHWNCAAGQAAGDGVSFLEAMRLLAGVKFDVDATGEVAETAADWSEVVAGGWLRETLERLRQPDGAADFNPNDHLSGTLRPYQVTGVKWLWFLQNLGLGGCLADDMGLGKTIQVIALLLRMKRVPDVAATRSGAPEEKKESLRRSAETPRRDADAAPSLIVAPASLLANWKSEFARFAPSLRVGTAHPSESPDGAWRRAETADAFLAGKDVVLTTYGQVARIEWLARRQWRLVVLDEAQAIKNPGARQTRAVKRLRAHARIALSGTPVENRLGDLCSLYDFLNPGLLGSAA